MLAYVESFRRQEFIKAVSWLKHQRVAGSNLADKALKTWGTNDTFNQFGTSERSKEVGDGVENAA